MKVDIPCYTFGIHTSIGDWKYPFKTYPTKETYLDLLLLRLAGGLTLLLAPPAGLLFLLLLAAFLDLSAKLSLYSLAE